jgi:hypothetical protein
MEKIPYGAARKRPRAAAVGDSRRYLKEEEHRGRNLPFLFNFGLTLSSHLPIRSSHTFPIPLFSSISLLGPPRFGSLDSHMEDGAARSASALGAVLERAGVQWPEEEARRRGSSGRGERQRGSGPTEGHDHRELATRAPLLPGLGHEQGEQRSRQDHHHRPAGLGGRARRLRTRPPGRARRLGS